MNNFHLVETVRPRLSQSRKYWGERLLEVSIYYEDLNISNLIDINLGYVAELEGAQLVLLNDWLYNRSDIMKDIEYQIENLKK